MIISLRKLSHAIIKKKKKSSAAIIENFTRKKNVIFDIFAQNINCGYTLELPRRGGSNEYPQFMFWTKNKEKRNTSAYPSFAIYIIVGLKVVEGGIHYTDTFS